MIDTIILATKNPGKIKEIVPFLSRMVTTIMSLADLDERILIPETGKTFEDNAVMKAETIFKKTGIITLADDSGLEVDALGGQPGVLSARFAGENASDVENNKLLLKCMQNIPDNQRQARFRCVMALAMPDGTKTFEGTVEGTIARSPAGTCGFGYDPIFIPDGYNETFGKLRSDSKLKISHRTRALEKVIESLKQCNSL